MYVACTLYYPVIHVHVYLHSFDRVVLSDCQPLGSVNKIILDADIRQQIASQFHIDIEVASSFSRAIIKQETYYSTSYKRNKTRNSYTVEYVEGSISKFGFVRYFLSLHSFSVAVITPLIPTSLFCHSECLTVLCKCVVPVSVCSSSNVVVSAKSLIRKCVYIDVNGAAYAARLPHPFYTD